MRILLYIGILIAVWLAPLEGTDVGKLIPVEVVAVSAQHESYTVRTDTGDLGVGESLEDALENLEKTASGEIYLDTAEYLLLEQDMDLEQVRPYMKGTVRVCTAEEEIDLEGIADFLSAHKPGVKLKQAKNLEQTPSITEENGRYRINKK